MPGRELHPLEAPGLAWRTEEYSEFDHDREILPRKPSALVSLTHGLVAIVTMLGVLWRDFVAPIGKEALCILAALVLLPGGWLVRALSSGMTMLGVRAASGSKILTAGAHALGRQAVPALPPATSAPLLASSVERGRDPRIHSHRRTRAPRIRG